MTRKIGDSTGYRYDGIYVTVEITDIEDVSDPDSTEDAYLITAIIKEGYYGEGIEVQWTDPFTI